MVEPELAARDLVGADATKLATFAGRLENLEALSALMGEVLALELDEAAEVDGEALDLNGEEAAVALEKAGSGPGTAAGAAGSGSTGVMAAVFSVLILQETIQYW